MKGHEMTTNEMELLGRLGDVETLPDESFEQARMVLQAAIALEGDHQVPKRIVHSNRRQRRLVICSGVAAGVTAIVAAGTLIAAPTGHAPKVPAAAGHAKSPLIRLADYVSASTPPSGNAALVARTTTSSDGSTVTVYDLYADNGQYFFSPTESGLPGQVSSQNDQAGGLFGREVAAAKLAATGDVTTAAQDMADAADPSNVISPTEPVDSAAVAAKEAKTGVPQVGTRYDNWVWEDSQDAMIAGSGQPEVRAGVLRILATLPGVTVTEGTSGGQPTLVLTGGADEVGYGYSEQLTVNATTGIPISFAGGAPGQKPTATVNYQVTRVSTSDIAAGKF
jgi:hypothetical protein